MGQRGVHATITQDERTGLITVNHVTVQWSIHIAEIIQFALQHAGKDGYTQDEFLTLLKKTVADMEHISAFNCSDEDDAYYDRHKPMERGTASLPTTTRMGRNTGSASTRATVVS